MEHNFRENKQGRINRSHDDWDEVHNQILEAQQKKSVQKKSLSTSDPGDADEKEADEIARKVTSGESATVNGIGGAINRKGEGSAEATPEFQSKLESSKGSGESLPENVQQEMGSKIGADFRGVKVHTGSEAHAMNENVSAKAFAHGSDIYFKEGEYNTQSSSGKELLAHELVHTVQQRNVGNSIQYKYETDEEVIAAITKEKNDGKLKTHEQISAKLLPYVLPRPQVVKESLLLWDDAMQSEVSNDILKTAGTSKVLPLIQMTLLNVLIPAAHKTHKSPTAVVAGGNERHYKRDRRSKFDLAVGEPIEVQKTANAYTDMSLLAVDLIDILNDCASEPTTKVMYPSDFFAEVLNAVKNKGALAFWITTLISDSVLARTDSPVLYLLDASLPASKSSDDNYAMLREKLNLAMKASPTEMKGGVTYTVKAGDNPSTIAGAIYGNQGYVSYVTEAIPKGESFRLGLVLNLPAVRIVKTLKNLEQFDVSLDLVKKGEAGDKPPQATPNVPEAGSGVSIGYGYDMKMRTENSVAKELKAAGLPDDYITAVKTGAGKGAEWIATNVNKDKATKAKWAAYENNAAVRAGLEKLLSDVSYPEALNDALHRIDKFEIDYQKKETGKHVTDSKIPFETLDPIIVDILVDLMHGGQMVASTWKELRESVLKNDVDAFTTKMLDDKLVGQTGGGPLYKRFNQRVAHMITRQIDRLNGYLAKSKKTLTTDEAQLIVEIEDLIAMKDKTGMDKKNLTMKTSLQTDLPLKQVRLTALLKKYKTD